MLIYVIQLYNNLIIQQYQYRSIVSFMFIVLSCINLQIGDNLTYKYIYIFKM